MKNLVLPFLIFLSGYLHAQSSEKEKFQSKGMEYLEKSEEFFETDLDSCIYYTALGAEQLKKAEDWYMYVLAIGGVGTVYVVKGDFQQAEFYYAKALQESRDKLGEEIYTAVNNYALFYENRGQYDLALELLYKALDIYNNKNNSDPYDKSSILQNIGNNHRLKGEIDLAIKYFEQALLLKKQQGFHDNNLILRNINGLAYCYRDKNNLNRATKIIKEGEKILSSLKGENANNRFIEIYTQLSFLYLNKSQIDSSQIYAEKALKFQQEDLTIEKDYTYLLLGQIAQKQNDLAKAIQHFKESKRIALVQHEDFPFHKEIAEADLLLAETYLQQKNNDLATDHYQKALLHLCPDISSLEELGNPPSDAFTNPKMGLQILKSKAAALKVIAEAEKKEAYYDEALNTYLATAKCVDEIRKSYNSEKAKQLLGGDVLSIYESAIQLAYAQYQATKNKSYLEKAFAFAEKNKANLILASLQEENALGQGIVPDSLLKKENGLKIDINYYKRKIQEGERNKNTDAEILALWKATLLDLEQKYDALQLNLEKDYPKYYQIKYDYPDVKLADIQRQIPDPNTLILEYFIGQNIQFVFAIRKQGLEVYPLELDRNFGQNIQDIHQILTNPPTSQNFPTQLQQFSLLSQNLYQQLIPFSIDPSIQQLLIIPDDILHYLPFEILCTNAIENPISFAASNFGYLLKDYAIHYAYSLTLWQQALQKKSNKAPKKWIGFAPSFKTGNTYAQRACEMNELYDLSCSKEEVNQIQTFFGGDIFLGQEANKENFQQLAADYQIIHLATHACVDNQDGDLNRIFLVDDFLNNNDLSNYNLNADLAVLSACNTGSGEIIKGEGIYSISRGFIMAGVPSTLTTLWSVDDCTTSNLMQSFYQKLDEGLSKAAALRNAKLEHLENAEVITTHPYFWAAFIQSGNPNAIKQSPFWYWWVALAIIAAFGVLFIFNRKRS